MQALIFRTNDTQDYAADALCAGMRDLFGGGNVHWNPPCPHLGRYGPQTAVEARTWYAWSDSDNRQREWGSWAQPPDNGGSESTVMARLPDMDLVIVGVPVGPRQPYLLDVIRWCKANGKPVALFDGGDVPEWPVLEKALPDGPWLIRAYPPNADRRAVPLPFSFSVDTVRLLYVERQRPIDVIWCGSRHHGYRDKYVDKLRDLPCTLIREDVMPYPVWADLLTRSKTHPAINGAEYVTTFEARVFEAAAFGCCVAVERPTGYLPSHMTDEDGFLYYDGPDDMRRVLSNLSGEEALKRGQKCRETVFAHHQPVHRAEAVLRALGMR